MPDASSGTDVLKVPNGRGMDRPNKTGDGTGWAGLFSSAGPRLHNHAFLPRRRLLDGFVRMALVIR